jgi:hypothetical protein
MVFLIGQYVYKLKSDILRYVIYKGYSGPGTAYPSGAHSLIYILTSKNMSQILN